MSLIFIVSVDGEWSDWADWEECDKKCGEGGGVQIRKRFVTPLSLYGMKDCGSEDIGIRPCNNFPCKWNSVINAAGLEYFKQKCF